MMNKIKIGLIGYGVVGQGVVKLLEQRKSYFRSAFNTDFILKTICDRNIHKKNTRGLRRMRLTTKIDEVLNDKDLDVTIELIGGMDPAHKIVTQALKNGKHVITANKLLIASEGKNLFKLAASHNRRLYFESAVGAGIPIIKTITEGVAGNEFDGIYGIINGTCNFILDQMTKNSCSFGKALDEAKKRGYAESNPTLDINGMDSTHKLAILINLAFQKFIKVSDIYTEGITHISHDDIEHANSLNLTIKLLAIAKKTGNELEARVHPTLISKDHPLAAIHGVYNAVYMDTHPLGNVILTGEGAGQMSAASGIISDLINLASRGNDANLYCNFYKENKRLKLKKIDQIKTKFYLRFMALDKPGVLSVITGILGKYGISINSVTQKAHNRSFSVPVIMLTDYATEKKLRLALDKIYKLPIIKSRPVAIRMEKLE